MTDNVFSDTDCISSFLWVKEEQLILKLYPGKAVLPQQVIDELSNPSIPHIKRSVHHLISCGDIAAQSIYPDTEAFRLYYQLAIAPAEGELIIGKGEAAAISLAKTHEGILASNNTRDISKYVRKYNLRHITTGDILAAALQGGYIHEAEGNKIWRNMLAKRMWLPEASFTDFLKTI